MLTFRDLPNDIWFYHLKSQYIYDCKVLSEQFKLKELGEINQLTGIITKKISFLRSRYYHHDMYADIVWFDKSNWSRVLNRFNRYGALFYNYEFKREFEYPKEKINCDYIFKLSQLLSHRYNAKDLPDNFHLIIPVIKHIDVVGVAKRNINCSELDQKIHDKFIKSLIIDFKKFEIIYEKIKNRVDFGDFISKVKKNKMHLPYNTDRNLILKVLRS